MSVFARSAVTVAAAVVVVGSPALVASAWADDCERSARSPAQVSQQSQRAQEVLADLGYQVHDIDDDDDDGGVNIEARRGGHEVDVDLEPVAKGQVDIEVEVEREAKGKKGKRASRRDDARACRVAEEILGRLTRG